MDLQLFIAINLLSLSALMVLLAAVYRPVGAMSWLTVNVAVLAVGAGAFLMAPDWAGAIVAAAFLPLVAMPAILLCVAQYLALADRPRDAAYYAGLACWFHPTDPYRFSAALLRAQTHDDVARRVADLQALMPGATPSRCSMLEALALRFQDDWAGIAALPAARPGAARELAPLRIRALGECGLLDDMARDYAAARRYLIGTNLSMCQLFVLAAHGRTEAVARLLAGALARWSPAMKSYWSAVAAKRAGRPECDWRPPLEQLADTARDETSRLAARRHLAAPTQAGGVAVTSETAAMVADIEERLQRQPPRRSLHWRWMPATLALLALNLAAFALEEWHGGSDRIETLVALGALWPPLVIVRGEWWRLVTALFLHQGAVHLAANGLLLFLLGRQSEIIQGSLRMLSIYGVGGLASSGFVLWLMWMDSVRYSVFVGASGAVLALVGAEAGRRARLWLRSRDVMDRRGLFVLVAALALQVAIDLAVPQISFAGHAAGFLAGLVIGLALGPRRVSSSTIPARC